MIFKRSGNPKDIASSRIPSYSGYDHFRHQTRMERFGQGLKLFFSTGGTEARAHWREIGDQYGTLPGIGDIVNNPSVVIPGAVTYFKRRRERPEKPIDVWRQTGMRPPLAAVIEDPTLLPRYFSWVGTRSKKIKDRVEQAEVKRLNGSVRNAYRSLSERVGHSYSRLNVKMAAVATILQHFVSERVANARTSIQKLEIPYKQIDTTSVKRLRERVSHAYHNLNARIASSASNLYHSASESISQVPYKRIGSAIAVLKSNVPSYSDAGRRLSERVANAYNSLSERTSHSFCDINKKAAAAAASVYNFASRQLTRTRASMPTLQISSRRIGTVAVASATFGAAILYTPNLSNRSQSSDYIPSSSQSQNAGVGSRLDLESRTQSPQRNLYLPSVPAEAPEKRATHYVPETYVAQQGDKLLNLSIQRRHGTPNFDALLQKYAEKYGIASPYAASSQNMTIEIEINHGDRKEIVNRKLTKGKSLFELLNREERDASNQVAIDSGIADESEGAIKGNRMIAGDTTLVFNNYFVPKAQAQANATQKEGTTKAKLTGENYISNPTSSGFRTIERALEDGRAFAVKYDGNQGRFVVEISGNKSSTHNKDRDTTHKRPVGLDTKFDPESSKVVYKGPLFEHIGERYTANLGKYEDAHEIKYERAHVLKGLFSAEAEREVYPWDLFADIGKKHTANLGKYQDDETNTHNKTRIFEELISAKSEPAAASVYTGSLFEGVGKKHTAGLGKYSQTSEPEQYAPREIFADVSEGRRTIIPQAGGVPTKLRNKAKGLFAKLSKLLEREYNKPLTSTPWLDRVSGGMPVYSR